MISRSEIKRHMLGSMEAALFMPVPAKRFDGGYDSMLRSFFIPIVLFPLTMAIIAFNPALHDKSLNMLSMVYSLRFFVSTALFLGLVWILCRETDRKEHFFRFATANNWLSIPATLILIPVLFSLGSGHHSWVDMQPVIVFLTMYTYAMTAFMAAYMLNIPFELGAFVAFIAMAINNGSHDCVNWISLNIL